MYTSRLHGPWSVTRNHPCVTGTSCAHLYLPVLIVQQLEHVRVVLHGKIQKSLNVFFAGWEEDGLYDSQRWKVESINAVSLSKNKKSRSVVINFQKSFSD